MMIKCMKLWFRRYVDVCFKQMFSNITLKFRNVKEDEVDRTN